MDAALRAALTFRSVGGVVTCYHARDKHGRFFAVASAGGERGKGRQGEDKSYFFHVRGWGFGG